MKRINVQDIKVDRSIFAIIRYYIKNDDDSGLGNPLAYRWPKVLRLTIRIQAKIALFKQRLWRGRKKISKLFRHHT